MSWEPDKAPATRPGGGAGSLQTRPGDLWDRQSDDLLPNSGNRWGCLARNIRARGRAGHCRERTLESCVVQGPLFHSLVRPPAGNYCTPRALLLTSLLYRVEHAASPPLALSPLDQVERRARTCRRRLLRLSLHLTDRRRRLFGSYSPLLSLPLDPHRPTRTECATPLSRRRLLSHPVHDSASSTSSDFTAPSTRPLPPSRQTRKASFAAERSRRARPRLHPRPRPRRRRRTSPLVIRSERCKSNPHLGSPTSPATARPSRPSSACGRPRRRVGRRRTVTRTRAPSLRQSLLCTEFMYSGVLRATCFCRIGACGSVLPFDLSLLAAAKCDGGQGRWDQRADHGLVTSPGCLVTQAKHCPVQHRRHADKLERSVAGTVQRAAGRADLRLLDVFARVPRLWQHRWV